MPRFALSFLLCSGALCAQTPTITAILNNYSRILPSAPNYGIAQGSIFIVKGAALADTTTPLQDVTSGLSTTLNGIRIRVTVAGVTEYAPLYYVLPSQLAGILPSSLPVGSGNLTVVNNGRESEPERIRVVKSALGILAFDFEQGTGRAVAHGLPAYTLLDASNATNPGRDIVFYGSGLGPSTLGTDETRFLTPRAMTEIPISFTIGGVPAEVTYHGRTIYPGLDQINVRVPTLGANQYGCDVAVVVTVNEVMANSVTIPIAESGSVCPVPVIGGGNTAAAPSQSEINTWAAAGTYKTGSIKLTRTTSAMTWDDYRTATTITDVTLTDEVDAVFSRVSGSDLGKRLRDEMPIPGSCVVYNIDGIAKPPYPNLTVKNLDAGTAVTSHGPNGAQVAPRQNYYVEGFTYGADGVPNTYLAPGRYTLESPGGADVGAFSGPLDVPTSNLVLTNSKDLITIDRAVGATVRWTGGGPSDVVTIAGESKYVDPQKQEYVGAGFVCTQHASSGEFTIPANILLQIPVSDSFVSGGILTITRGSLSMSSISASTRLPAPSGLDILTATYTRVWTVTPQYD